MQTYACGFLFSLDRQRVLLIRKRRPAWQAGKLNGLGGKIEPGETPDAAARREVLEETGLVVPHVEHLWTGTRPSVSTPDGLVEMNVFCAPTDARQEDVVLGEGQAMVFLSPEEALSLDLGVTAAIVVPRFLASADYRALAERAQP